MQNCMYKIQVVFEGEKIELWPIKRTFHRSCKLKQTLLKTNELSSILLRELVNCNRSQNGSQNKNVSNSSAVPTVTFLFD
jgi:hypothetical protein